MPEKEQKLTIVFISMIREPWGGSEELWAQTAAIALDNGHTVIHHSFETGSLHPKVLALVKKGLIIHQRPGFIDKNKSNAYQFFQLLVNFLRKKICKPFNKTLKLKPNIVVYNGTCYSIAKEKELLKWLFKQSCRLVILGHYNNERHRDISSQEVEIIKKVYKRASDVCFVSQRSKETAEQHLCEKIEHATIITNPVNLLNTDIIPYPETKLIQFACVGNLVTVHKAQDVLLKTLALPDFINLDWELNIYGSGYDHNYLTELTSFLGLSNKVHFHGKVTDIRKIWESNHLLMMPSHMEGMPLAVVEAMLCGRPSIVTDVGGHTEWIEDNKEGFVAPASTVNCLKITIKQAIKNLHLWEQMGINAHKKAKLKLQKNPSTNFYNLLIRKD